mmetsp:Transcript_36970/g.98237  ORF Transcript_36970/g.98237 Transcript_36970/m.98237 type:complete len:219 (+) Transcript_36970:934-1590(+)
MLSTSQFNCKAHHPLVQLIAHLPREKPSACSDSMGHVIRLHDHAPLPPRVRVKPIIGRDEEAVGTWAMAELAFHALHQLWVGLPQHRLGSFQEVVERGKLCSHRISSLCILGVGLLSFLTHLFHAQLVTTRSHQAKQVLRCELGADSEKVLVGHVAHPRERIKQMADWHLLCQRHLKSQRPCPLHALTLGSRQALEHLVHLREREASRVCVARPQGLA